MRWILDMPFALSASFHDGARLVSYPWGSWHNDTGYTWTDKEAYMTPGEVTICGTLGPSSITMSKSLPADHDEFYRIATAYSFTHPTMKDKPKVIIKSMNMSFLLTLFTRSSPSSGMESPMGQAGIRSREG